MYSIFGRGFYKNAVLIYMAYTYGSGQPNVCLAAQDAQSLTKNFNDLRVSVAANFRCKAQNLTKNKCKAPNLTKNFNDLRVGVTANFRCNVSQRCVMSLLRPCFCSCPYFALVFVHVLTSLFLFVSSPHCFCSCPHLIVFVHCSCFMFHINFLVHVLTSLSFSYPHLICPGMNDHNPGHAIENGRVADKNGGPAAFSKAAVGGVLQPITLRVFLDHSMLEAFTSTGQVCFLDWVWGCIWGCM